MAIVFNRAPLQSPTIGTAGFASTTSVYVPFTQPADNGGVPIQYYVATSNPGGITATITQSGSGTITITGLTPGQTYTFTVQAYNYFGLGPASLPSNNITILFPFHGFNTPALMNGSSTFSAMNSVAVNSSGLFVAVGYGSNNYPVYATSSNGSTWTTPATMNGSSVQAFMYSVAVNSSGLFVAVGYNNSFYPFYATSSNGSTWTTPALMNGSTTVAIMNSVAVNSSGLFVAVGGNTSSYPVYATSSNGSTWTTPALMNGSTAVASMFGVTVNSSGLFVAVGYNNSHYPVYATPPAWWALRVKQVSAFRSLSLKLLNYLL